MKRIGDSATELTGAARNRALQNRARTESKAEPIIDAATVSEALPGQWLAVTGPRLLALLAPTATRRVLRSVWQHAHDGKGVQEILDVLTADGLRDLMDFVAAEWNDVGEVGVEVRVLVRGSASARLITTDDEDLVIETGQVSTWVEKVVPQVVGIQLFSDPTTMVSFVEDVVGGTEFVDEHMLPLGTGAVRAGALILGQVALENTQADADDADDELEADEPFEADEAPEVEPAAATGDIAAVEATQETLPQAEPVDEQTVMTAPPAGVTRPAAAPAAALATITFSNGEAVALDRDVYVGRDPKPRNISPNKQIHLVTVASAENDISRTHFKLGSSNGRIMIRDLKSTGGTTITVPGTAPRLLGSGEAAQLAIGTVIEFGETASAVVTDAVA